MTFPASSELGLMVTRWFVFVSTVALLGLHGLACFVFPPAREETLRVHRRLKLFALGGCLLLLLAAGADVFLRCSCVLGMATACSLFCPMMWNTHMGHLWMLRTTLCTVLLLTVMGRDRAWLRWLRLLMAVVLGACLSYSSHAADQGNVTLHLAMDGMHAISAGLWLGGLFSVAFILWLEPVAMSPDYLAEIVPKFSTLAGICIATLMIGGAYNTWVSLPSIPSFWTTPYGRILSLKLVIFGVLACFGALNRYHVVPQIQKRQNGAGVLFKKWIRREVWLGLIILGITALLSETMPPHRMPHNNQEMMEQPSE